MTVPNRPLVSLLAAIIAFTTLPLHADDPASVNGQGLVLVDPGNFDTVYASQGADLSAFDSVYIERPTVGFRKNWMRDQNRYDPLKVRDRDVERIQDRLADLMHRVVAEEFSDNGFSIATAPAPGVLVVRPNIVKLDLTAPDLQQAQQVDTYSESAGEMTLDLELADGGSGEPLLQILDRKRDPRRGYLEWRTRPSNTATARRMMRAWARDIREVIHGEDRIAAKG